MKPSHKKFCYAYLRNDFNATDAARQAGYSKKNAANIGSRLLKKESIKAYISQSIEASLNASKSSLKHRIINELETEAFASGEIEEQRGENVIIKANPNKLKALELLAKYANMLTDKLEVTGKDGGPVVVLNFKNKPRSKDGGTDSN